jgi:pSer/pThr/pTyr-binding forkhead associated (FHA) protein
MFEFEKLNTAPQAHWQHGVCYCGSAPLWKWHYQIRQILSWEREGIVRSIGSEPFTIGRDDCTLTFPQDRFISQHHACITTKNDPNPDPVLVDTESKNGTYYRIRQEVGLKNGDYLFIGKQLIRVELR